MIARTVLCAIVCALAVSLSAFAADAPRTARSTPAGDSVAEVAQKADIPVVKVSLYSSGVGYFEHRGSVTGNVEAALPFSVSAVNDVLKSLVINDPASASPSVMYPAADTLAKTLKSLKVDLSGHPGIAEILDGLRGSELVVSVPDPVTGRIIGVETRAVTPQRADGSDATPATAAYISLLTKDGIRVFALSEISSFGFTDKKISDDLARALDLILSSRDAETRVLRVILPEKGPREVSVGYVIPSPVWKASYRLDLAGEKPFLQGWAIVDNASDMDWSNVELSLVTGKPVSFIQNLYPPLNLPRPVVPLSIAGIAEAETYDSGFGAVASSNAMAEESLADYDGEYARSAPAPAMAKSMAARGAEKKEMLSSGVVETAVARASGEQFEFTVKRPVTLPRQQSAMIPLVEAAMKAEKVSVFSGEKAASGGSVHPMLCAELTNSAGMKLPAGPITVFDDGAYAGDALIEFFPENDKRLIAYGEDLSVTGIVSASSAQEMISVVVSHGVMTLNRKYTYMKEYALKNASAKARRIIVEHPFIENASLTQPAKADEKTDRLYRFSVALGAGAETKFTVKEQQPVQETVVLSRLSLDNLLYYRSSSEIPAKARAAFDKAVEFKKKADDAQRDQGLLEAQKRDKIAEQDRVRKNLEAAGSESQQGKDYLKKLSTTDADIDALSLKIDAARKAVFDANAAFANYLSTLTLD